MVGHLADEETEAQENQAMCFLVAGPGLRPRPLESQPALGQMQHTGPVTPQNPVPPSPPTLMSWKQRTLARTLGGGPAVCSLASW